MVTTNKDDSVPEAKAERNVNMYMDMHFFPWIWKCLMRKDMDMVTRIWVYTFA